METESTPILTEQIRRDAWEQSYGRHENFVFVPAEEVVRFVARTLRKRVGLEQFVDVAPNIDSARILDAGCGIGRNLVFGWGMRLQMYGIDLSSSAVKQAHDWLASAGFSKGIDNVVQGDLSALPWADEYFDHALSDSVLDSMHTPIAMAAVAELARVMKRGGLLYANLIAGEESDLPPDFAGERVVDGVHEFGTIQSYYNLPKIRELFERYFHMEEAALIRREDALRGRFAGRWHVVLRRT